MNGTIVAGDGGGRERKGKLGGKSPAEVVKSAAEAGLPAELGAAVLAVTGKTKLWNSERTEVARELCSHFLDGLEVGASVEELRGSFGGAKNSARLITRAKKRNRPWAWKVMRRTLLTVWLLIGLVLAWYGWNAARFYLGSPTIKFNVQAEMNAVSVAVPLEQRAWPLYRDAARSLRAGTPDTEKELGMLNGWPGLKPGTQEWARASALLDARPGLLEKIKQGAAMDRSAYVVTEMNNAGVDYSKHPELSVPEGVTADPAQNPIAWAVLLPQLSVYRSLARVLVFDTRRAVEERRCDDAVADIEAMLGIGRHAREDGTLISQLVSIAIDSLAVDTVNDMVPGHVDVFTDEQLARLAHVVGSCRASPTPAGSQRVDLGWERRFMEDTLQRFFTDDGSGDGRLCQGMMAANVSFGVVTPMGQKYLNPVIAGVVASRKETWELMSSMIGDVEVQNGKALYERNWAAVEHRVLEVKNGGLGVRYSLAAMFIPSLVHAQKGLDLLLTQRDAAAGGLAVELFKRKTGRYPSGWSELTPRYLPSVPLDRWSGRGLCYKAGGAAGGRPLIYSVGADKTDDGGVIGTPWFAYQAAVSAAYPALAGDIPTKDWVIWPPVEDVGTAPMGKVRRMESDQGFKWGWLGPLMGQ